MICRVDMEQTYVRGSISTLQIILLPGSANRFARRGQGTVIGGQPVQGTCSYPRTKGALYSALISRSSFRPSIYGW